MSKRIKFELNSESISSPYCLSSGRPCENIGRAACAVTKRRLKPITYPLTFAHNWHLVDIRETTRPHFDVLKMLNFCVVITYNCENGQEDDLKAAFIDNEGKFITAPFISMVIFIVLRMI